MQIYSIQCFSGRNIYSHKPVVKMVLNIGDYYKTTTKDIPGFNEKLIKLFPGLGKHHCSLGYEGGFLERLKEGTYIGHVTEHLILELQCLTGSNVNYGKTRVIMEPSLYYIVYQYENEKCAVECGRAAVDIVTCLAEGKEIDIDTILHNLKKVAIESEMGPSTKSIYDEAKRRGIPVTRIGNESLLQLGYGKYRRLIEASLSDAPSCINVDIAGNKHLTKQILMDSNIPVPFGELVYTEESAVAAAREIGFPLVLKPYNANQGKGVTLDIRNEDQVRRAYREAAKYCNTAIVERYIPGKDYRVLVVGGKVAAVAERRPPMVTGDGVHTVKELVDIENMNPLRGDDHEKPLTKIKLDEVARQVLAKYGMDENYVPEPGKTVRLRENGNLSTGGTAKDCTDLIHPYNCALAVKAAELIGLDIAGIDITAEDISVPLNSTNGAIIEVNAAPGLRMHLYPTEGKKRNIAGDILDMMFPEGRPFTIPIISVTGTNGKTTTTRLIRHTLSLTGKVVGMTSTSGIYIGDECILKGDNTGPISARMVLSDSRVEAAVLETARGGIVRKGLGYDLADVGVVINVSDDHLGLDGIETLEDLAFAKSLVLEAVKPDGYAVINADDEMAEYMISRVRSRMVLFSRSSDNPLVVSHIGSGGKAVYMEGSSIYICNGKVRSFVMNVEDIPITFGGMVDCNIENSLAAVSALFSVNVSISAIRKGLRSFKPDTVSNPGRFNLFDMGNFKVMLDYGHNPAGYKALIKFLQKTDAKRLVGIIGVPGDRLDRNIREVGEICGKVFSNIYIKEDRDLRGRKPGEVADILYEGVMKSPIEKENVKIIRNELEALETAMLDAQPGDMIVMLYEEFEPAVELVSRFAHELEKNSLCTDLEVKEHVG
ncbi:cyanophycin synthetase [Pseudoclostridium thermosuccinogenes]|uniref:cyanophycin synthetase n=1 Tax=Clostridium thermosuccinogenes TaxID=84032 RepID=UPI002FD8933A